MFEVFVKIEDELWFILIGKIEGKYWVVVWML